MKKLEDFPLTYKFSNRRKIEKQIIKNFIKNSSSIKQAIRFLYYNTILTPYFHPCDYEDVTNLIKKKHRKYWKNFLLDYVDNYKKNLTIRDFLKY
jgi:hypothetical protein